MTIKYSLIIADINYLIFKISQKKLNYFVQFFIDFLK